MPQSPKRPCAQVGCGALVDSGRCAKHKPKYDTLRPFYWSRPWRELRHAYLRENPLCVEHQKQGIVVIATEVDHVIDIADGGARFEWANLQALCKSHHSAKTRRERGGAF